MKTRFYTSIAAMAMVLFFSACGDPCNDTICENGGNCWEGDCNCTTEWTGENCEVFKCDELNCDNGDCENGECQCDIGYGGALCQIELSNNFVGNWDAQQNCVQTGAGTSSATYSVGISKGDDPLEIVISQLSGVGGGIRAYIDTEDNFTIPDQNRGGKLVAGGGSRSGANKLQIDFTYGSGSTTFDCTAVLTR